MGSIRRRILLVFTLSGASALVYQVIWARQLGLVFGNTTISVSVVLGAFMAGLALGAFLAGRSWVLRRDPMRLYAILEGAIGLYALAFPWLVRGLESAYPLLFSVETPLAVLTAFRSVAAFGLLLVPTTMMGATLPLTTEYVHRLGVEPQDWNAGRLYGANTAGAALGSFLSGFVLIELIGITGTLVAAACLNFAVAALGLWLSGLASTERPPPDARPGNAGILLLYAVVGALALAGEVLWTRSLTLLLGSSTYAFSAILIVHLVGIALGSWTLAGFVRTLRSPVLVVPLAIAGAGAWHGLAVLCFPALYPLHDLLLGGELLPGLEGAVRTFGFVLAVTLLIAPPAFLSGSLFPAITRLVGGEDGDQGTPVARAYTWNTLGAIGGSLGAGFVVAPLFLHFQAIYLLAALYAALALVALARVDWRSNRALCGGVAAAALLLLGASSWMTTRPDLFARLVPERRPGFEVVHNASDRQGITTVIQDPRRPGPTQVLMVNGAGMTTKVFATKAMAHLPIAAHGRAEETLVVCFGMGTTFRSALAHGGRVDVVELVPGVIDAFPLFYADAARIAADPRGRRLVSDGRNFLLLSQKRYDVITVDPPPPIDSAGVNSLYSREFVELMRDHLAPGGIAAHWIPAIHASNGVRDAETFRMLIATFVDVFPHVRAVRSQGGVGLHLLGALEPFELDPVRIEAALAAPPIAADLREYPWDRGTAKALLDEVPLDRPGLAEVAILTDDRPRLEFNLIRNLALGRAQTLLRVAP